jgi:DHA1 family multidrug resistance protein-like MFS transporter
MHSNAQECLQTSTDNGQQTTDTLIDSFPSIRVIFLNGNPPMNSTKADTHRYAILVLITCGISFGCYFASSMRLPVVPLYAKSLGMDASEIGLINSFYFLMAGLLSFPLGLFSDRFGRKRLAVVGLSLLTGASFLLYVSDSFARLAAVYLLSGIGIAAFGPTMMSYVADFSPVTHLGRSYGWYTTSLFIGMSLGPAAGGYLARLTGFLPVFLASAILLVGIVPMLVLYFPSADSIEPDSAGRRKRPPLSEIFLRNRTLLGCWLAAIGGTFGMGMFITYVPLHADDQGLNVGQIGIVFFAQGLVNAVSRIPFGHLSDRVGRRQHWVVIGLAGFVVSLAGFGISTTFAHFLLFAMLMGIGMALAFTSVGALVAESVPLEARGLAMGGYNSCVFLGFMLCSATMGPIIEAVGFAKAFFLTAGLSCVLTGVFYFMVKEFNAFTGRTCAR